MRIVFHVGMGKTGTSSIQRVLSAHQSELAAQKALYLGMWFDRVAPRFRGHEGLTAFAAEPAGAQAEHAATFFEACARQNRQHGTETFILSNEGLFGHSISLEPFFKALMEKADVRILAYVRPPRDWLPSAFTQWNLHHKQQSGPIQPFRDRARQLVAQYGGVGLWVDRFGDRLILRRFDKSVDIVADFAAAVGLTLPPVSERFLERREPAEVVLRALFNNRFDAPVLPERFERQILNTNRIPVQDLREIIEICFAYEEIDEIIAEKRRIFDDIERRTGIALTDEAPAGGKSVDPAAIRERVVDYLVTIMMEQSARLQRMERRLNELEEKMSSAADS